MNTDSFILYIKTGEIYTDITKDAESRFDTSNYELDRQYKKVIGLIKDQLGGKIMQGFTALRAKKYSYLTGNNDGDKKSTRHKKLHSKYIKHTE